MFFFNWERSEALSVAKGAGCKRSEKRLNPVGDSRRSLRKNETFI